MKPSPVKPRTKYPRRLSSTPIKASWDPTRKSKPQTSLSPTPDVDFSLEEALLHRTDQESVPEVSTNRPLPSPRLSRIVVDTSRKFTSEREGTAKPTLSSLRKSGQQKSKSRRGLTVSFVQHDAESGLCKPSTIGAKDSSSRKFTRHATQRNLDSNLVDSLNSTRYGAMERRFSKAQKEEHCSKLFPGDDPRLGYDWIAGLLDASEPYLSERDNRYFEEIDEFRKVNFDECHRPKEAL